eukprot:CAMPEP_0196585856 /NCGR_PEP_ID=MMETSP1081-20130531/52270_1 /TAXON_ID=36882 /ORGANISM="Pyramimonas amylifera, Strain CCMP720" /LENGTH=945 /DNA_ID=CAMNT_0041907545 /DNA_START=120 /DNA_END=2957 /DNA_ORIENTATION=-
MSGWLNGVVKAVHSGDCVTIMGRATNGPPPEKVLTLASLVAPRLARPPDARDEPHAWESREFLRRVCIGREVVFRVDYSVPSIGREFGSVHVRTEAEAGGGASHENLAFWVVQNGWARVRQPTSGPAGGVGGECSPDIEELIRLSEAAQNAGVGVWAKEEGSTPSIRDIPSGPLDSMQMLEESKGKALPGIVEYVVNGGMVRLTLLPDFQTATVFIAGVQCPSMSKRGPQGEGVDSSSSGTESAPEAYAREAKHLCEMKVLHREVRVVLCGVDKYGSLFGALFHPEGGVPTDLGEQLVSLGLAKVVDWSASMLDLQSQEKLRRAERVAKDARLRVWKLYTPPPKTSSSLVGPNFTGQVVEVVSGDLVVVRDAASLVEQRVCLSSVRAPRTGNPRRDIKPEPYAPEAKDFLRQRLVGKQVSVQMEYSRTVALTVNEGEDPASRAMDFGSINLCGEFTESGLPVNVGEMLVVRGLGTVARHRGEEERAHNYEALLQAEAKAIKNKKGIHSAREPPVHHLNDLSIREAAAKARQYLPFFQRSGGRIPAVVEVVLSGHRLKLLVPKESVMIAFSLAGVRAPGKGKPGQPNEPYSDEAMAFVRHQCMQRDVQVEIESVDKTGTFLGSLYVDKMSLGLTMLERGLASLHPMFNVDRTPSGHLLKQAETRAKEARLCMWTSYDPSKEAEAGGEKGEEGAMVNGGGGGRTGGGAEVWDITVAEVKGGGEMYVHRKEKADKVNEVADMLNALGLKEGSGHKPSVGELCCAKFSEDDQWYRAKVEKVSGTTADVFYIDFGNRETLKHSSLALISEELKLTSRPPLAHLVRLAGIKVPGLDDDFGYEAAELLSQLSLRKTLRARVEDRERAEGGGGGRGGRGGGPEVPLVTLLDPAAPSAGSVNSALLKAGLARCVRPFNRRIGAVVDSLKAHQEEARASRTNIWQYGDVDSDEDM